MDLKRKDGKVWIEGVTPVRLGHLGDDWEIALTHWQTMCYTLDSHPALGPLPPILRNLAIAHETLEQWESAAEAWSTLLDMLPRRISKKAATGSGDGVSVQDQRAWLRRRILNNYLRADRPDQAISYYKQVIKATPDDLDLRLELASALLANDQTIAARNELHRILDRDPNHLDACLMLAEVHQMRDDEDAAGQSLRRALAIDPGHNDTRRALAQMLLSRGVDEFNDRWYQRAYTSYQEALSYAPDDPQLLVFLAETELLMRKTKAAQTHLEAALETGEAPAFILVFTCWVKKRKKRKAQQIITRAETAGIATPAFYVDAGIACITHDTPPSLMSGLFDAPHQKEHTESVWVQWGREFIRKGLTSASDRVPLLHHLGDTIGAEHPAIAIDYANQLIEETPQDPLAFITLGIIQSASGDTTEAGKTLRHAERLARKQGQTDQAADIAEMRRRITSPIFDLLRSLPLDIDDDFWEDE